jgi:hypothetical protein
VVQESLFKGIDQVSRCRGAGGKKNADPGDFCRLLRLGK